ncbi:MAG: serine hydrolase [Rubellimicrobium sp.]|nr:serine hydrolase [Rubellimicrobium sp.]
MRACAMAARRWLLIPFLAILWVAFAVPAFAAPYAAFVMDARTGQVFHAQNADTRLHPASLTKMMTLYVAFVAIERGEIGLDTEVRITAEAAAEPPSRLGLRTGQTIRLRYLLRAAAVKSANDAATAIGIAIAGSQEAFAARMNATAAAMGMTNTHFITMNGLTREGHYSTARDMSVLGRHVIYDFPQYYNLFSRRTADAGIAQVTNTNTRFLDAYPGADGIKTGYTVAAGYNLTASAERGGVRIIATIFGATSTANRNQRMTGLLDMGFAAAPARANTEAGAMIAALPGAPQAAAPAATQGAARTIRVTGQVQVALRPPARPANDNAPLPFAVVADNDTATDDAVAAALAEALGLVDDQSAEATTVAATEAPPEPETVAVAASDAPPAEMPDAVTAPAADAAIEGLSDIATVAAVITEAPARGDAAPDTAPDASVQVAMAAAPGMTPAPRPDDLAQAARPPAEIIVTNAALALGDAPATAAETVTRLSSSDPRTWGIHVGSYNSQAAADRVLIQVAVAEAGVLGGGVRRIVRTNTGFDANIVGLNRDAADLACRRLQARGQTCFTLGSE